MNVGGRSRDRDSWWSAPSLVVVAGVALGAGLVVHLVWPTQALRPRILRTGLVLLMATPAVRILIAVAERIRRRDVPSS